MTGLPTLLVKLDDGTGTFPYDISSRVRLADGYTITRGRADEFGEVQPAVLAITLENINGDFTYGSVTYSCFVDQMIQVSLNAGAGLVKRFTGYVQSWPVSFPDGSDQFAVAAITATDRQSKLSRQKLRSITEQEILADAPSLYYTLGEAAGAISAGDTSGNSRPPLGIVGTGTAPVFGTTGPNTWDGLSGCTFAGGQYLRGVNAYTPAVAALSLLVAFQVTTVPSVTGELDLALVYPPTLSGVSPQIYMSNAGTIRARADIGSTIITSASSYADGAWHVAELVGSGGTWTLYVDGISVGSGAGSVMPTSGATFDLIVGFDSDSLPAGLSRSVISHAAVFPVANSAARALAHANAIRNGLNTERSDQRIARLAGYTGIATGAMSLEVGAQLAVPAQSTSGGNAGDAIAAVNNSEGGITFIRGDGNLVMQNRMHRSLELTPVLSLTAIDVGPDVVPTVDMQKVVNYAEVTAAGTGAKQAASNAASITAHGQYPTTLSPLVATNAEALDRANWVITTQSAPQPRIPGVRIDLLTQTAGVQQTALTLELSDRLTVTGLPSQTPGGTTATLVAEGWTETWKLDTWDLAINTSNWEVFRAWLLDNATYSVLGTTTRLYF